MAGINREGIAKRILKSLVKKDLMKPIVIYRDGKNAFGEKQEKLYVCTVKGYYYRKENRVNTSTTESATVNTNYSEKLLVVYSEESAKIQQDDYFTLEGTKYKVIDTGNTENIVFDMYLNRM